MSLKSDLLKQARFGGRLLVWGPPVGPIKKLFANGEQGVWYDPSDLSTLFQDAAGTTPVTADGDPVGLMLDKSGNGNHATQAISASRPIYQSGDSRGVVNLLRWSEAFDNAAWVKSGVTVTPIETPSPVSGKIYELAATAENSSHTMVQGYNSLTSQSLRTFYVKRGTARYIALSVTTIGYNTSTHATFDFDTGEWAAGMTLGDPALDSRGTLPPEDIGDGWWALTVFREGQYYARIHLLSDASTTNDTFVGSGETCYVAATQVEGPFTVTPYQRNDSHTGGVGTGLPTDLHWLEFDGVDDYLWHTFDANNAPYTTTAAGAEKLDNSTGRQAILGVNAPNTVLTSMLWASTNTSLNWGTYQKTTNHNLFNTPTVILNRGTHTPALQELYTNGELSLHFASNYGGDNADRRFIGKERGGLYHYTGKVFSIYAGNTYLEEEDISELTKYIASKSGVTL